MSQSYKFCITCGSPLIVKERIYGYDPHDGLEETLYDYKCPEAQKLWIWRRERHPCTNTEAFVYFG